MAVGYEGLLLITNDSSELIPVLCTGASFPPRARNRIDSSGAYGGKISSPVDEIGLGSPHTYDRNLYNGNFSFELSKTFLTSVLKPWYLSRQTSKQIKVFTRSDSLQDYQSCFWNNISLNASENSIIGGSVSVTGIDISTETYEDDFIGNKIGVLQDQGLTSQLASSGNIAALNSGSSNEIPLPFWNTQIEIDGSTDYKFLSWTLNFTQEVVKMFACEHNVNPQDPAYMAVGPMSVEFTGDILLLNDSYTPDETISSLKIHFSDTYIEFRNLEMSDLSDDLQTGDNETSLALSYSVYEVVA